jgi:hypothetical protein
MLSSTDWALLVTLKKELEDLKALYVYPRADIQTVIVWMEYRIKDIEMKDNGS